jgi:hypothetical protein
MALQHTERYRSTPSEFRHSPCQPSSDRDTTTVYRYRLVFVGTLHALLRSKTGSTRYRVTNSKAQAHWKSYNLVVLQSRSPCAMHCATASIDRWMLMVVDGRRKMKQLNNNNKNATTTLNNSTHVCMYVRVCWNKQCYCHVWHSGIAHKLMCLQSTFYNTRSTFDAHSMNSNLHNASHSGIGFAPTVPGSRNGKNR